MSRRAGALLPGLLLGAALGCATPESPPAVVLFSLDAVTPAAARSSGLLAALGLPERGALAERLLPVFPTNTFPNHVTLVTGVAPAVHGIVDNEFVDPRRGAFRYAQDPSWIEVEPLWSLLQRHGIPSAAFHWPGSEGAWPGGFGPDPWRAFDGSTPAREKVEQALAWLSSGDPAARPRLVTVWLGGADRAAHRHGPDSREVRGTLARQGRVLARFAAELERRGLLASTTLLFVSDHGVAPVTRHLQLDRALRRAGSDARVSGGGGFATLAVPGGDGAAASAVRAARALDLEAYPRGRAPAELGVGHPRFGDVVVLAPPGTELRHVRSPEPPARGAHGYRADLPEMHGFLAALGRGVEPGAALGEVRALDVAPTVLALLGLPVPDWMEGAPIPGIAPTGTPPPPP